MIETYYAGSYWLARQESAEACAHRAERLFHLLGRSDPAWSLWYETAGSFEDARQLQLNPDAATFTRMFGSRENQSGDRFQFWVWTGENPDQTTSVNGFCGSSSPRLASVCVLKPPAEGPVAERVLTATVLSEVVRAMALAWEPEWAVATSHAHRDLLPQPPRAGTFVGWVMYFSRQRGTVPPLPAPVRVEPVEDQGTLVILTPERFTASNPEHVALAARVHALLEQAGLLGPLQPHTA